MRKRIKKMSWKKSVPLIILGSLLVVSMAGCDTDDGSTSVTEAERPAGWTDETHGNDAEPDYDVVFAQDEVNQIKITITADDWEAMQTNMTELFGVAGTRQDGPRQPGFMDGNPGAFNIAPDTGNVTPPNMRDNRPFPGTDNITPPVRPDFGGFPGSANVTPGPRFNAGGPFPATDNMTPGMPPNERDNGIPGWVDMTPGNPEWVLATIEFNGLAWTNVGIRYKGNSSLTSSWRNGSLKRPFKLDFDQFEDEFPAIDNQRFYGFKQLSFSNAFSDATYMHDALGSAILTEAGLPAAQTAYYEVVLDYGEGEVNLGLYVCIEVVDDTVIDRVFGDDSGNIYEGDGPGVSLAQGTYNQIEDSFLKENNKQEADWSDIQELYNVLHADTRVTDPAAWRANLEAVFDVDTFLNWLAIAAIVQHWDTYGSMSHNFYLYDNPDTGLLTWISWDHNQILAGGGGIGAAGGRAVGGVRFGNALSLGRDEVTDQWPLIRYLLDDPVYYERYTGYIQAVIDGAFDADRIAAKCEALAELIEPYITQETDATSFENAVRQLINNVYQRYQAAENFLAAGE